MAGRSQRPQYCKAAYTRLAAATRPIQRPEADSPHCPGGDAARPAHTRKTPVSEAHTAPSLPIRSDSIHETHPPSSAKRTLLASRRARSNELRHYRHPSPAPDWSAAPAQSAVRRWTRRFLPMAPSVMSGGDPGRTRQRRLSRETETRHRLLRGPRVKVLAVRDGRTAGPPIALRHRRGQNNAPCICLSRYLLGIQMGIPSRVTFEKGEAEAGQSRCPRRHPSRVSSRDPVPEARPCRSWPKRRSGSPGKWRHLGPPARRQRGSGVLNRAPSDACVPGKLQR